VSAGVSVANAYVATLVGDDITARRFVEAWPDAFDLSATPDAVFELWIAPLCHAFLGDLGAAITRADHCVRHLRVHGALGLLTPPLFLRSFIHFRRGEFLAAYADAAEAHALTHGGPRAARAFVLTTLGRAEAGLGRLREAEAHLEESLALCRELHLVGAEALALAASGLLKLGPAAAPEEALRSLGDADALARTHHVAPMVLGISRDLVEAAIAANRPGIATDHLALLGRSTAQTPWIRATMSWASARLGQSADMEGRLTDAVALYREAATPFDEGRTLIDLARYLRRSRRPGEATRVLNEAVGLLDRLGAAPWSAAGRELMAAPRSSTDDRKHDLAPLTPAELRVAAAAAQGATTREVAAQLSLSPRTVEHHLGSIYAKLDLRSRAELAWFIGGKGRSEDVGPQGPSVP
jgi:DNA-binding CsgD family transcriptional regulator